MKKKAAPMKKPQSRIPKKTRPLTLTKASMDALDAEAREAGVYWNFYVALCLTDKRHRTKIQEKIKKGDFTIAM